MSHEEEKNTLKTTHSDQLKTTLHLWIHWYHHWPRQEGPFPWVCALWRLPLPSSGQCLLPGQRVSGTKGTCLAEACALPF